jgi:hypothetical protein
MPTSPALTHLAGYNRIADAIEALTTALNTNNAALIAAMGNNQPIIINVSPTPITVQSAAPMITVSPSAPQITVAPAAPMITVSPSVPQITVQASDVIVQPNITVSSSTNGDVAHGADCGCMDGILCALAPGMASLVQMNKAIQYLAKDTPLPSDTLGEFPDPRDSDPPQIFIPSEATTPASPPPGGFVAPPGGMAGGYDLEQYHVYKCDMAHYIVEYLINYYQSIADLLYAASSLVDWFSTIKDAQKLYATMAAKSAAKEIIYNAVAVGGVNLTKTLAKDTVEVSCIEIAVLVEILVKVLSKILELDGDATQAHADYLKTRRKALVCALLKGEKTYDSVNGLNKAAAKFWKPNFDFGQGYAWAGINSAIINPLVDNLFACKEGYDFSSIAGFGDEMGGCDGCNFDCAGATLVMDFNNGKQGWYTVNPPVVDNSFGEAIGNGIYGGTPDNTTATGMMCFKNGDTVTIKTDMVRSFSQICVHFGGRGASFNEITIYVNEVVAFQGSASLDLTITPNPFSDTISFSVENDLSPTFLSSGQVLVGQNTQVRGTIKIVRRAGSPIGAGDGEARIFGVALG